MDYKKWPGYYIGKGEFAIRYAPKQAEILSYRFAFDIPDLAFPDGKLVVNNLWPGKKHKADYKLGANWYTDKTDPSLYDGKIQGGKTILEWRSDILHDWARRWEWLR